MTADTSLQSRVRHLDNARYHGGTRSLRDITLIVMHATEGESAESSMGWLNRPNVPSKHKASYHYLIDRDGTIFRTLPITTIAYHAGDSAWPRPQHFPPGNGGKSVNRRSIGIAWANRNDGESLTDEQVTSAHWLVRTLLDQIGQSSDAVVGHYEVSPGRKSDPKPALDMDAWRDMVSR